MGIRFKRRGEGSMKIALNLFDISKIGGIKTYVDHLKYGLEELGHTAEECYISCNKKSITPKYGYDKVLGFMTDDMLKEYHKAMEEYDLIIFIHPNPHNNKSFNSLRWKDCYEENVPIIVALHDSFLDKYNTEILKMMDKIKGFAPVQPKATYAIKKYTNQYIETKHPLILKGSELYDSKKEDLVIQANQFRSWKCNDIFIRAIPFIDPKIQKEVYSSGIEQCKMAGVKRNPKYGNIWEDGIKAGMQYEGDVSDINIQGAFKRSKCIINMATLERRKIFENLISGSIDYTQLEAMKYGSIPIGRQHNIDSGMLTSENIITLKGNDISPVLLADKVNEVIYNWEGYKNMRTNNLKYLKENYDSKIVASRVLSLLDFDNNCKKRKELKDYW